MIKKLPSSAQTAPARRAGLAADEARVIIERLGGTSKVAELCGVSPASVSQWKSQGVVGGYACYLRLYSSIVFNAFTNKEAHGARSAK